jgi:heme-degrading monooxygenase HmoA
MNNELTLVVDAARLRSPKVVPGQGVIVPRMTRSQMYLRAKSGKRMELLQELDRLEVFLAVRDQPGFLAAELLVTEDDADAVLVESSWSSPEHYERWRLSPAREGLLRELRGLVAEEPEARIYHLVDAIS